MIEFIDQCGVWLLRIEVLCVFVSLVAFPFYFIKALKTIKDKQQQAEGCGSSLNKVKLVLQIYGKSRTRAEIADGFVRHGITFMKGPFRNPVNFTPEEFELLPTNDELAEAVRRAAWRGCETSWRTSGRGLR